MPTLSGSAFHFLTNSGVVSSAYGGIIPDPIELQTSYVVIDGKTTEITATSGALEYLIVEPGDYPINQTDRDKRCSKIS
jgi:hypothetical protein